MFPKQETTCKHGYKKGQHVMHGSKTRDNMASMVTKRYNMATLYMFWNFMTCEATRPSKRPINTMVCQVSHPCKSLQKKSSKKILTQTNPPQTHLSPSLSHGKHQDPHPLSHSICLRNPLKISSRVLRLGREIASDSGVGISQTETVNNGEARRTRAKL